MRRYLVLLFFFAFFGIIAQSSYALTGREIIEKADALPDPKTAESTVLMLIFKGGSVAEKEFVLVSKDYDGNKKVLISFTRPTQIKLLTHTYKKKEDDQWLRLSSGKVKRIVQSDKDKSFVNSHFWYEDLTSREIDDYEYTYVGEGKAAGFDCYKVDAVKKGGGKIYEKNTLYARKSDCFIVRIDFYRDGKLLKYLENYDIKTVNGILTPYKAVMAMADAEQGGKTELIIKSVRYNHPINDSLLVKESLR